MGAPSGLSSERTTLTPEIIGDLGPIEIEHPHGTFVLTPASLIALRALARHTSRVRGQGLDWGSGSGCMAITAARIPSVRSVMGLELVSANVEVARHNAVLNGVGDRTLFMRSDSYSPFDPLDRERLDALRGGVDFILANPPSSDGDDGFGFRREVIRGAASFLRPSGALFLSISWQYGSRRIEALLDEAPGVEYGGELASTDWVPFDLSRPDLHEVLVWYGEEEGRGGLPYRFGTPGDPEAPLTAQEALGFFRRTGASPLTKWQSHLFTFRGQDPAGQPSRT